MLSLSPQLPSLSLHCSPRARPPMPPARPCRGSSRCNQILQSIEGPVAKIIAVIIIIVTGLTLAFGDTLGRLPPPDPDRVRPVDRLRRVELLPVVLLVRRRGARLMDRAIPIAGLRRAGPSRADRADPARRRAALGRDPQRHAGGGARPRPAPLAGRPRCSGRSVMPPPSGRRSAIRCSSMSCAGICASPAIWACEAAA